MHIIWSHCGAAHQTRTTNYYFVLLSQSTMYTTKCINRKEQRPAATDRWYSIIFAARFTSRIFMTLSLFLPSRRFSVVAYTSTFNDDPHFFFFLYPPITYIRARVKCRFLNFWRISMYICYNVYLDWSKEIRWCDLREKSRSFGNWWYTKVITLNRSLVFIIWLVWDLLWFIGSFGFLGKPRTFL